MLAVGDVDGVPAVSAACASVKAIVKPTHKSAAKMVSAGANGLTKWAMEATLSLAVHHDATKADAAWASKMCDMQRGVVNNGDVTDALLRREDLWTTRRSGSAESACGQAAACHHGAKG